MRGRKLTETNKYINDSRAKIADWKLQIKKKKIGSGPHKTLRNKIAALESRVLKRIELRDLQD